MKLIKKRIFLLFYLFTILSARHIFSEQCNDLIMILDPSLDESEYHAKKNDALFYTLCGALLEETAPIIVSSNIVENYCNLKKELTLTQTLFNPVLSAPFNLIELNDHHWQCYIHKHADLIVLIPQNYINQRKIFSYNYRSPLEQCGFNDKSLIQITNVSGETLLKKIEENNALFTSENFIAGIKSLFIEKSPENKQTGPWNIYLTGHGGPQVQLIRQYYALEIQKKQLEEELIAPDKKNLQNTIKKLLIRTQLKLDACTELLRNKDNHMPETAQIAGVTFQEFKELMNIFNSHINTSFLFYSTCYSGGYNQTAVNTILQQLNVNFITMTKGFNESVTFGKGLSFRPVQTWAPSSLARLIGNDSNEQFTQFFATVKNIFCADTSKLSPHIPSNPLATIAKTIINLDTLHYSQPFVRIPSIGTFKALDVDKKVKILTNTMVKIHEFENNPINIIDPETEILIIYPSSVKVPLKLHEHVAIVSPTRQDIKTSNESIHIFDEIITDGSLASFISELAVLNKSYSTITFVVKKLTCLNKKPLGFTINNQYPTHIHNLIFQISLRKGSIEHYLKPHLISFFTVNNTIYKTSYTLPYSVINYEQNWHPVVNPLPSGYFISDTINPLKLFSKKRLPEYWDIVHHLKIIPHSNHSLDIETDSIINPTKKFIVGVDVIPFISKEKDPLAYVVQKIEEKINDITSTEKPGSITKTMLMKQLDSIEKSVTLSALEQQQKWLAKEGKALTPVNVILQRYRTQLTTIKQNVERLASTNIIDKDNTQLLLQKINSIKASIDFAFENATTARVVRKPVLINE